MPEEKNGNKSFNKGQGSLFSGLTKFQDFFSICFIIMEVISKFVQGSHFLEELL